MSAAARVLVIDDESIVCLSCTRILQPRGYDVQTFQDPRAGLQEALTGGYDLILLDLVMPELAGMQVLKRLREAEIPSKVVIITGHASVETAVEAMKRGATDYLAKPFSPDQLLAVLSKALEAAQ
ncbi:MAG: response regulator [Planctomycetota bacterium]|jgi:DNA-binding NtrC family response regulator